MAGEAEELEALFVRVYARTENFFAPMKAVREEVGRVVASFAAINGGANQAVQGFAKIEAAAAGVATAIQAINTAAGAVNISGLVGNLSALASSNITTSLTQLAAGINAVANVDLSRTGVQLKTLNDALRQSGLGTKTIANVTQNIDALRVSLRRLKGVAADIGYDSLNVASAITRITDALRPLTPKGGRSNPLGTEATAAAVLNIRRLLRSVSGIAIPQASMDALDRFLTWLPQVQVALTGVSGSKRLFGTKVAQDSLDNLNKLATSLTGLATAPVGNIANNIRALARGLVPLSSISGPGLVNAVGVVSTQLPLLGQALRNSGLGGTVGIARIVGNLTSLSTAMTSLGSANAMGIMRNAVAMRRWFDTLSGIGPDQLKNLRSLSRLVDSFTSFNAAFANVNRKLPIQQNINYNLHATQRAAQAASLGLNNVTGSTNRLARSMIGAHTSLTLTRLSLAAFAGFGVVHFARFDELMARTMARMGEFSTQARERLGRGVLGLSTRTTTDAGHLASALGVLSASGMNQPMAMQVLPLIETHAAASGLEAARSARHLTSVLSALGMTTGHVTQDIANLNRISNVFIRTSQLVDASVEELSDAFNARYAAAVRQVGWTLEQGMSLITAYANANVRGADAGNRASIVLQSLEHALVGNLHAWQALGLGVEEFNAIMARGPGAVIHELERRLSGLNPVQQRGLLERMGFESRVTQALYPILGLSHAMDQVGDNLTRVDGIAQRTADIIRQSFGGQIKILWNNLKAMAIDIGDTIAPAVGWLSNHIRDLVTWFRNLSAPMQRILVWGTLAVTVIAPVVAILATLKAAMATVLVTFLAWTGPLVIIKGLLIGTVAAILGMAIGWEGLKTVGAGAVRVLETDVRGLGEALKHTAGFLFNIQENLDILSHLSAEDLGEITGTVWANMQVNIANFIAWFARNWRNLWEDAKNVISVAAESIGRATMVLLNGIVDFIKGAFKSALSEAVTDAFRAAAEAIRQALTPEPAIVGNTFNLVASNVRDSRVAGAVRARDLSSLDFSEIRQVQEAIARLISTSGLPEDRRQGLYQMRNSLLDVLERRNAPNRLAAEIRAAFQGGAVAPFRTEALPGFQSLFTPSPEQVSNYLRVQSARTLNPLAAFTAGELPAIFRRPSFNTSLEGSLRHPAVNQDVLSAMRLLGSVSPMGGAAGASIATTATGSVFANLMSGWLRMNRPMAGESDFTLPSLPGGRSPGTSFATMAERRFVIGGPGTARIEQSVKDAEGDNHLRNIQQLLGTHLPNIAENTAEARRPPTRPAALPAGGAP